MDKKKENWPLFTLFPYTSRKTIDRVRMDATRGRLWTCIHTSLILRRLKNEVAKFEGWQAQSKA